MHSFGQYVLGQCVQPHENPLMIIHGVKFDQLEFQMNVYVTQNSTKKNYFASGTLNVNRFSSKKALKILNHGNSE